MSASANDTASRDSARVMNRTDLCKRLVAHLKGDEAVVGGIGNNNFDLWAAGQRPLNFYMLGSMGLACPIALGLALAQPQRRVVAIEGDGSILMQLGSLGTIAVQAQKNLVIVIMDNGIYQITGKQPTLTARGSDIVAIARGAGITQSFWAADEADFEARIKLALSADGPWLIAARIDDQPPAAETGRNPARIRDRFMQALGVAH